MVENGLRGTASEAVAQMHQPKGRSFHYRAGATENSRQTVGIPHPCRGQVEFGGENRPHARRQYVCGILDQQVPQVQGAMGEIVGAKSGDVGEEEPILLPWRERPETLTPSPKKTPGRTGLRLPAIFAG